MAKQLLEMAQIQNSVLDSILNTGHNGINNPRVLFVSPSSLRLTSTGCKLLTNTCKSWTVESPGATAGALMELQDKMIQPYYLDKTIMVLFDERDAFMAKLGGSAGWLQSKE